jgi:DNA-binding beta-propeller fold protein YncE
MLIHRTFAIASIVLLPVLMAQDRSAEIRLSGPEIGLRAAPVRGSVLPNGFRITPTATPGSTFTKMIPGLPGLPSYLAGQPMTTAVSPDGKTLLVLTSGYNLLNGPDGNPITNASAEYVFVYDISANKLTQKQVLPVPTAFGGIAWNPSGNEFYVGGAALDTVFIYTATNGTFAASASVAFNHPNPTGLGSGLGLGMPSIVAGVSVNALGNRLLAANYTNASVTLVDIPNRKVITELDLRPGVSDPTKTGVPGGEYPFWVSIVGNGKAYVSSVRDREIDVLSLANDKLTVTNRIAVEGNPNKMILNRAQSLLIAAEDNADAVVVVDTALDIVLDTIPTTAPNDNFISTSNFLKGSNTNSVALSPDEKTLYATNGGTNSVAVIALNTFVSPSRTIGLIPTAWYPDAVAVSADGSTLFVANAKSVPGPNPGNCTSTAGAPNYATCAANDEYVWQLEKGGMLTIPVPTEPVLDNLTAQVGINNNFNQTPNHDANEAVMAQVRAKIQHVIYVIKENRTYDQILGDLPQGNGDPGLVLFGAPYTPNQHQIANQFVTHDNFYDSGEVSGVGWNWSTAARATDSVEKTVPPSYANRFGPSFYEYEGTNSGINVG